MNYQGNELDEFIELGKTTRWLLLGSSSLYVRHFYKSFFEGVLNNFQPQQITDSNGESEPLNLKCVISGNPGIGKSAFGMYLLFRALRMNKTVVYHSLKGLYGWVFEKGNVYEFDSIAQCPQLKDLNTVYISDSIPPKSVDAMTVLITSPQREKWKEFRKEPRCRMVHFPEYSYKEMCVLRSRCFPQMILQNMNQRYYFWGGNPRCVLMQADVSIQDFEREIQLFALDNIELNVSKLVCSDGDASPSSVSHRMFTIKVQGECRNDYVHDQDSRASTGTGTGTGTRSNKQDPRRTFEYYKLEKVVFASDRVASIVYKKFQNQRHEQLLALIDGAGVTPGLSGIRGALFEKEALSQISKGGLFKVKKLLSSNKMQLESTIEIPSNSQISMFTNFDDLQKQMNHGQWDNMTHLRPSSNNWCAMDVILPGGLMANATVNRDHELILKSGIGSKNPGALSIARLIADANSNANKTKQKSSQKDEIPFYWLVPSDVYMDQFDRFKIQTHVNNSGTELTDDEKQIERRIVQYMLHIQTRLHPISSSSTTTSSFSSSSSSSSSSSLSSSQTSVKSDA